MAALNKPRRCSVVVSFAGNVVIYPRIWWREPPLNVLSQLIAYKAVSVFLAKDGRVCEKRTSRLVYVTCDLLHHF